MKIVINHTAAYRSSLGVRRYFEGVMRYFTWESGIGFINTTNKKWLTRPLELLNPGGRNQIIWSPGHRGPLWARHHVITVHDCINVEYVHRNDWRIQIYKKLFQQVLNNAEAVVAISEATKVALYRNYKMNPAKLIVIKSPINIDICPPNKKATHALERPYILMVTNSLPHKNTTRACKAIAKSSVIRNKIILRVVGSLSAEALTVCEKEGIEVEIFPWVTDELLSTWYANALFIFSPSLDEGHNLIIAEALSVGGHVLCSDIAVHREFYDSMVKYCDPYNIDAMAVAIDASLEDRNQWNTATYKYKRSFKDVAADYLALFKSIENKIRL